MGDRSAPEAFQFRSDLYLAQRRVSSYVRNSFDTANVGGGTCPTSIRQRIALWPRHMEGEPQAHPYIWSSMGSKSRTSRSRQNDAGGVEQRDQPS